MACNALLRGGAHQWGSPTLRNAFAGGMPSPAGRSHLVCLSYQIPLAWLVLPPTGGVLHARPNHMVGAPEPTPLHRGSMPQLGDIYRV